MKTFLARSLSLVAMAFLLVLTACDSTSTSGEEDTVILSDRANPTQETFEFSFAREDYDSSTGTVTVTANAVDQSPSRPDLDTILRDGYLYDGGRSVIVNASVTGVEVDDVSSTTASAGQESTEKLFPPYLTNAEVYLQSTSGPRVGEGNLPSDGPVDLSVPNGQVTVTSTLKDMSQTQAALVLAVNDPGQIPTQSEGGDKVDVVITYRIEAPLQ